MCYYGYIQLYKSNYVFIAHLDYLGIIEGRDRTERITTSSPFILQKRIRNEKSFE